MSTFDLPAAVRRIRRAADLSQRELAGRLGASKSAIARVERGHCGLDVRVLARAASLGGLRLALVDDLGGEVPGMSLEAVRDRSGRLFPAHLDTRHGDEDWWHGDHRYARKRPRYTFDRLRYTRDHWRDRQGTPDDHQLPRPGDSLDERRAARQHAARLRREEDHRRRREAGSARPLEEFTCSCPPRCDELDDRSARPVHVEDCPCSCDLA